MPDIFPRGIGRRGRISVSPSRFDSGRKNPVCCLGQRGVFVFNIADKTGARSFQNDQILDAGFDRYAVVSRIDIRHSLFAAAPNE